MPELRQAVKLYLVTDGKLCSTLGVAETVQAAIAGGVTMVQLRDKSASTERLIAVAKELKQLMFGTGVPLIINDDIQAARAADADGVHIGQSDDGPKLARELLGPEKIIGLSCETVYRVRNAPLELLDYLGLGPVLATNTKGDHDDPIGFGGLKQLAAATALPTVAIGGLKHHHCHHALNAGVDGIAVVSAICGQANPQAEARKIRQLLEEYPS